MSERVLVPGTRDVRATLDTPDEEATTCVVACPPYPKMDGDRTDSRLTAVADALTDRGVACLRFDYGPWDDGHGEKQDALDAVDWALSRYDRVGVFGFSFGGAISLLAAASRPAGVAAVSALAPAARIGEGLDAVAALDDVVCPVQVVYATRDDTADWEPVVERARELGYELAEMQADHFFVGQTGKVGGTVAEFLVPRLSAR